MSFASKVVGHLNLKPGDRLSFMARDSVAYRNVEFVDMDGEALVLNTGKSTDVINLKQVIIIWRDHSKTSEANASGA